MNSNFFVGTVIVLKGYMDIVHIKMEDEILDIRKKVGWIKYCDIEQLGTPENEAIFDNPEDEIIVEEKIDGGNTSFLLDPTDSMKVLMFSRNQPLDVKMFIEQQKWLWNNIILP